MEIRTAKKSRENEDPAVVAPPEKSMYLRRKTTQQVRKSYSTGRSLLRGLRIAARLCTLGLACAFLVSVFIYAFTSSQFSLQTITFYGCSHLDTRRVEAMIRSEFPSHIMRIDLKRLRSRLEEQTWCRGAEIRRILPSELVIYVQERVPTVILEIKGELMLADDDGILLDRYDSKYGKLDVPVFKGVLGDGAEDYRRYQEENTGRVQLGLKLLRELESGSPVFTREISEVDLSERGNVRVTLVDDTAEIYLGDRDFLKRFRILMSNMNSYREIKQEYMDIVSVDLRFDGQIIYRPRKTDSSHAVATAEVRQ